MGNEEHQTFTSPGSQPSGAAGKSQRTGSPHPQGRGQSLLLWVSLGHCPCCKVALPLPVPSVPLQSRDPHPVPAERCVCVCGRCWGGHAGAFAPRPAQRGTALVPRLVPRRPCVLSPPWARGLPGRVLGMRAPEGSAAFLERRESASWWGCGCPGGGGCGAASGPVCAAVGRCRDSAPGRGCGPPVWALPPHNTAPSPPVLPPPAQGQHRAASRPFTGRCSNGRSRVEQRPPPSGSASRSGCQLVCPGSPSSTSTSQDQHRLSQPGVPCVPPGGVGAQTGICLALPPSRQVPGLAAVARCLPGPPPNGPIPDISKVQQSGSWREGEPAVGSRPAVF